MAGNALRLVACDHGAIADQTVRVLGDRDLFAFRAIRLEALREDGRCFAADPLAEAARTPAAWAAHCRETAEHAVFGAWSGNRLVGIMAATAWQGGGGRTVKWGSAYLRAAHRRSGIGAALYRARERWSLAAGFTIAVFAIRADNLRSIEVHRAQGAQRFDCEMMRYADGCEAPTNWYFRSLLA